MHATHASAKGVIELNCVREMTKTRTGTGDHSDQAMDQSADHGLVCSLASDVTQVSSSVVYVLIKSQ